MPEEALRGMHGVRHHIKDAVCCSICRDGTSKESGISPYPLRIPELLIRDYCDVSALPSWVGL